VKPDKFSSLVFSQAFLPVWLVLSVGLALSATVSDWLRDDARRSDQLRFDGLTEKARHLIDQLTENYLRAMQETANTLGAKEEPTERDWQLAMQRLQVDIEYPGIVEMGVVRVRLMNELPEPLRDVTADDFEARDLDQRRLYNAARRFVAHSSFVIEDLWNYVPRTATKPPGQGFRGESLSHVSNLVTLAIDGQAPRMTDTRIVLRTKKGKEIVGTTLILSVPNPALAQNWSSNIWQRLAANNVPAYESMRKFTSRRYTSHVLYASFDWHPLNSTMKKQLPELRFDIFAGELPDNRGWLGGSRETPLSDEEVSRSTFSTNCMILMYSQKWLLRLGTAPVFAANSPKFRPWMGFWLGGVLSLLSAALLAVQICARGKERRISDELRHALVSLEISREGRDRLGRDLHDGAIQSLYALQLRIGRMMEQTQSISPDFSHRLKSCRDILTTIIGELRGFILQHEAKESTGADFGEVLSAMIEGMQPSPLLPFELRIDSEVALCLDDEQAIQLANIAREAFSNSLRHANGKRVSVTLEGRENLAVLSIRDDGCGFDTARAAKGMGMKNMLIRTKEMGGEMIVHSRPGRGTEIVIRIAGKKLEKESLANENAINA